MAERETFGSCRQSTMVLRPVAVCRKGSEPAGDFLEFAVGSVQPDRYGARRKDAGQDEIDVMIPVNVVGSKLHAWFIGNLLDQQNHWSLAGKPDLDFESRAEQLA